MKILHISDIHMKMENKKHFANMIIEVINDSLKSKLDLSPDVILITGDFTNTADASEFDNAQKELKSIKEKFPNLKECLIVPGNHDYLWSNGDKKIPADKRSLGYRNFKKSCEYDKLCISSAKETPKEIQKALDEFLITHFFIRQEKVAFLIIGMNSDMLESETRKGQGYFDIEQHKVCRELIKHYKEQCEKNNIVLIIIAAFHHHILPVSSVERDTVDEPDKFSLTLDARRTLNFFMENDVRLAVHGHQHQPSIVYWKDEMRKSGDGVYIISAGSMSQDKGKLGDVSKNNFMIYDIDEKYVKVYCFQNTDYDWDKMELIGEPYILTLNEKYDCNGINIKGKNSFIESSYHKMEFYHTDKEILEKLSEVEKNIECSSYARAIEIINSIIYSKNEQNREKNYDIMVDCYKLKCDAYKAMGGNANLFFASLCKKAIKTLMC